MTNLKQLEKKRKMELFVKIHNKMLKNYIKEQDRKGKKVLRKDFQEIAKKSLKKVGLK